MGPTVHTTQQPPSWLPLTRKALLLIARFYLCVLALSPTLFFMVRGMAEGQLQETATQTATHETEAAQARRHHPSISETR